MQDLDYQWLQASAYIAAMERFIAEAHTSLPLTDEERERLRTTPESELELPVGYEEFIEATEVFPQLLRRSTLVLILTLLESNLNEVCRRVQGHVSSPFSVYDLQGRGIERAAVYIDGLAGVNPRQFEQWQDIQNLRHVRDALVHNNGSIRAEQFDQPAARVARAHPLLEFVVYKPPEVAIPRGVVLVNQGLCEWALEKARSLSGTLRVSYTRDSEVSQVRRPKRVNSAAGRTAFAVGRGAGRPPWVTR